MANNNTIAFVSAPSQVINATTETLLGPAGSPLTVGLSNNANFNAKPFLVRLRGTAAGGTTTTLQFKLYLASASTIGTSTAVAAFTAAAQVGAAGGNFDVSASFIWDSVSQALVGTVAGQTVGTITAYAVATGATGVTSVNALDFVASAKFSAANATNQVTVTEFVIDQA
jgi:hypothetical protein